MTDDQTLIKIAKFLDTLREDLPEYEMTLFCRHGKGVGHFCFGVHTPEQVVAHLSSPLPGLEGTTGRAR